MGGFRPYSGKRWLVAAALSAAVTSTDLQGIAPYSQGKLFDRKLNSNPSRFPGGSAREGPFSERPPPSQPLSFPLLGWSRRLCQPP